MEKEDLIETLSGLNSDRTDQLSERGGIAMRFLLFTSCAAIMLTRSGGVLADKAPLPTTKKIVGSWKAVATEKLLRVEVGVFSFKDNGEFVLDREHALGVAKGKYAVEGNSLKITVIDAEDGVIDKGVLPATTTSFFDKEIVLDYKKNDRNVIIHLSKIPNPDTPWHIIEQDRKQLNSKWEYVATEKDGKVFKDKLFLAVPLMSIDGDKAEYPESKDYAVITFGAIRKLKAIQLRFSKGKGIPAVYAYDLNGDTFRLCEGPNYTFPNEFTTKGTNNQIHEFKRAPK